MSDCILGSRIGANGYARLPSGKRGLYLYAHRVVWEQAHGSIPEGMHLHHTCETKACVNVDHLELLEPRAHFARHRRCDHDDRYVRPDGHRSYCRTCHNERQRPRERERYANDSVFRDRKKRGARKQRARKEVGGGKF